MKRKATPLLIVVLMICVACASNIPWRKATVTTFELVGATAEQTRPVAETLYAGKVISEADLAKVKKIYNDAVVIYAKAGAALKLAGQTEDAVKRDALLAEYEKLLAEFKTQSLEIYKLITKK